MTKIKISGRTNFLLLIFFDILSAGTFKVALVGYMSYNRFLYDDNNYDKISEEKIRSFYKISKKLYRYNKKKDRGG